MSAQTVAPVVHLVEAGPEQASVIDRLVAAFHRHEGVRLSQDARQTAINSLLVEPVRGRILLIQTPNGETVGYAVLAFGFSIEFGGRDAFLDELFIDDAFRSRGLGTAALAAVCNWADNAGLCALHLEVGRDNETAKALYTSAGFADRSHYQLMSLQIADVRDT